MKLETNFNSNLRNDIVKTSKSYFDGSLFQLVGWSELSVEWRQ